MDLNPILMADMLHIAFLEMNPFIYNLPDTFINMVLDHLPLKDLLHCNLVCRQWNKLYRAACDRRRVLTLIIAVPYESVIRCVTFPFTDAPHHSHQFSNWYDEHSPVRQSWLMRIPGQLDHRLVYGLMRNFAKITTLEIILNQTPLEALDHVTQLLRFWSHKLISLKLWLYLEGTNHVDFLRVPMYFHLIDAINSLSSLTHLTMNCPGLWIGTIDSMGEPMLAIQLENLREFNWFQFIYNEHVCRALCRYAQSRPNLRVGFDMWFRSIEETDATLFTFDNRVASQIDQLCLCVKGIDIVTNEQLLARFSEHFSNLTTLNLMNNFVHSTEQWTKAVSRFPRLIHLKVTLMKSSLFPDHSNPPTRENITQLKSIKVLDLGLDAQSHNDLQTLHFTWTFPNLEMIYIDDSRLDCDICGAAQHFDYSSLPFNNYSSVKNRHEHCRKLLLRPLKELEHLGVVKYYNSLNRNVFYSKEDL